MANDNDTAAARQYRCWYLAGASCLAAVVALVTAFPLMMIGACAGWVLALVGVCLAILGGWRSFRESDARKMHGQPRRGWLVGVLCVLLLVAQTMVCLRMAAVIRDVSKSVVSAANLKGIYDAIQQYAGRNGLHPRQFEDLVQDGSCSPKLFVSPFDGESPREYTPGVLKYSSYEYVRMQDAHCRDPLIVLAYEHKPVSLGEARLLAERSRWVLFGDRQTRLLSNADFDTAMARDRTRRQELGWPTDVVYTPSTCPTSQQATKPTAPAGGGGMK